MKKPVKIGFQKGLKIMGPAYLQAPSAYHKALSAFCDYAVVFLNLELSRRFLQRNTSSYQDAYGPRLLRRPRLGCLHCHLAGR